MRMRSPCSRFVVRHVADGAPGRSSRALGQSQVLAHHQGLMYFDDREGRYHPGRFWSEDDVAIRDMISELKAQHPDLPVDPGSLHRPA